MESNVNGIIYNHKEKRLILSNVDELCCGKDFTLGEHFDTSNVTDMSDMFSYCSLSYGFSLGEHFTTSNVTSMVGMFYACKLPEGFSLGEHFDTSNVTDMRWMFEKCTYGDYYVYDYLETESDDEIIEKLREF